MTAPALQQGPALDAMLAHLTAHDGRIGEQEAPLAMAVLDEYLAAGAALGRSLREVTARFRPSDSVGALVAYLYVITVDAANHEGREGALLAFAESGQALSADAARLYATLTSDAFAEKVGRRPIVGRRPC